MSTVWFSAAQEVESIIPGKDTKEGYQGKIVRTGMEYVQLIPVLVNALKSSKQQSQISRLIAALEGRYYKY